MDKPQTEPTNRSTKGMVKILLDPKEKEKYFLIGASLEGTERSDMIEFLSQNADVFAWTQTEITGINPEVITH